VSQGWLAPSDRHRRNTGRLRLRPGLIQRRDSARSWPRPTEVPGRRQTGGLHLACETEAVPEMTTQHHTFAELLASADALGESGIAGAQLVALYREAAARSEPTILELGTETGASTTMFLQAVAENGGRVVSVDIEDCSMVADSERWIFVQADSTDVQTIITAAPTLKNGIDVLYVDSLHTRSHVRAEVEAWWPLLKEGAAVFFDDVDAAPYRAGRRKDSPTNEHNWDQIHDFILAFFHGNIAHTRLEVTYGSTGLAKLLKASAIGTYPAPPDWRAVSSRRFWHLAARLRKRLRSRWS
jgi:predicted O-methyltransferase YrrM